MIRWTIADKLARSPRPGDMHLPARKEEVCAWIDEAKSLGIRSIICLLSHQELHGCYFHVKIDLLGCYRDAGLEVKHYPISEYSSRISPEQLAEIHKHYLKLPKPCLVHCKAGIERTGQVVDYLVRIENGAGP